MKFRIYNQLLILKEKERSRNIVYNLSLSHHIFIKFLLIYYYYYCRVIANMLYSQSRCPSVKKMIKLRQSAASICVPFWGHLIFGSKCTWLSFKMSLKLSLKSLFIPVYGLPQPVHFHIQYTFSPARDKPI